MSDLTVQIIDTTEDGPNMYQKLTDYTRIYTRARALVQRNYFGRSEIFETM